MRTFLLYPTFSPCAFLQCSSTVGVNFYCTAALSACICFVSQYFMRTFPLCFSLHVFLLATQRSGRLSGLLWGADGPFNVLGRFLYCFRPPMGCIVCMYFYCIPALFACISVFACYSVDYIFSVSQHCMRAYLLCSSTFLRAFLLCFSTVSVRIPTAFQHWLRAFLLQFSTFSWVNAYHVQHFLRAHFYSIPALPMWISTALQHSWHAFLWGSSTFCVHFHRASVCMYFFRLFNVLGGFHC